jgi:hypothetical protein
VLATIVGRAADQFRDVLLTPPCGHGQLHCDDDAHLNGFELVAAEVFDRLKHCDSSNTSSVAGVSSGKQAGKQKANANSAQKNDAVSSSLSDVVHEEAKVLVHHVIAKMKSKFNIPGMRSACCFGIQLFHVQQHNNMNLFKLSDSSFNVSSHGSSCNQYSTRGGYCASHRCRDPWLACSTLLRCLANRYVT